MDKTALASIAKSMLQTAPEVYPYISIKTRIFLSKEGVFGKSFKAAGGDYTSARATYWAEIYDSVHDYLESSDRATSYKSDFKQAVVEAFTGASEAAWQDAGNDLPLDDEALSYVTDQMNGEMGNVDSLFASLVLLRKEDDTDAIAEAFARADGYCNTLDGFYNSVRVMAMGNQMLTFTKVRETKESCDDCLALRGQRHRASWFVANGYVPPSGDGLACGAGGNCGDELQDDQGNTVTI
jgi:hypothetical protein